MPAGLQRELREETGLRAAGPPVLIGTAQRLTPGGRHISEFSFLMAVDGMVRLSHEHDRAVWHRPGDLPPGPITESAAEVLGRL
jgi:ADP-ribose pyrophosphatase YjhB (NUDIX family)